MMVPPLMTISCCAGGADICASAATLNRRMKRNRAGIPPPRCNRFMDYLLEEQRTRDFTPVVKRFARTLWVMRAVVQRVSRATVTVEGEVTGEIGRGLLVFLGVAKNDSESAADYLAKKILSLRIFDDAGGKMNLSLTEVGGSMLVVSQFTLYGDVRKGKRPSFDQAAPPEDANRLYEYFVGKIRASRTHCETGRFRAMMDVELVNDGPVTLLIDSERQF